MGACECLRKDNEDNCDNLTAFFSNFYNNGKSNFNTQSEISKQNTKLKSKNIIQLTNNNFKSNNINNIQNIKYENEIINNNEILIGNNLNIENLSPDSNPYEEPQDVFSYYIFKRFNSIRKNPQKYIKIIDESKSKITYDKHGRLISKSNVKVALITGEKAFDNAIEFLKITQPMEKLIYNPKMNINIPKDENDIKDKIYLKNEVEKKKNDKINIKIYWKDYISDAETCFILTIVDDSKLRIGSKREDILNPKIKYIGISSGKIGKSFVCYFTFS